MSVSVVDRELNVGSLVGAYVRILSTVLAGFDEIEIENKRGENS